MFASPTRPRLRAATVLRAAAAATLAATALTATATAASRDVVVVGNAFGGSVSFLDGTTYENLGSMGIAPDKDARIRNLFLNPLNIIGYNVVKNQKGGENLIDDMAILPDGKTIVVSRGILQDVVAFDIATRKAKWRFETGSFNADHMAISPDGTKIAVSASSIGFTHLLNAQTGKKIHSFGAGDFPHGVDFSADGNRMYIGSIGTTYLPYALNSQKGNRQLTVVDVNTKATLRTYRFDAGVRPTVITHDESKAYLQLSYRRGFVELDTATGQITRSVHVPGNATGDALFPDRLPANSMHHGLAMNEDETKLCNAGTIDNEIAIVDRATFTVDRKIGGFAKPYWSQTARNGDDCLVSNSTGNYVSVISYATGQETKRVKVGTYPQRERLGSVDTASLATLSKLPG